MMKLVTWNIQWGLGCDGRVDLQRIVETARLFCDADVFCFQEISKGFFAQDGGEDQPAILASLLPNYVPIFRPAVEFIGENGESQVFGNMILSRLPVLNVSNHMLPWPADECRSMRRQGLEVLVAAAFGPIRVTTCHLEYHSIAQRKAQVDRLRELHDAHAARDRLAFRDTSSGPYRSLPQAVGSVICGDFNFEPDDLLHALMCSSFPPGAPAFIDAWTGKHGTASHAPTAGLFDHKQWPQGPHCRDYIFVSGDLAGRIEDVRVEMETAASDHQPVAIAFRV